MHRTRLLGTAFTLLTLPASAQPPAPIARVFHPTTPLPSFDVATIKPFDPTPPPNGVRRFAGITIRDYIRTAYSPAGLLPATQVVGGPEWIDRDRYNITGKPSADLELAMQKMTTADRLQHDRAMQQSLLADRFHLKIHFEVREMPVYALEPAKGGLKIKAVADPASPAPDGSPSSPAADKRAANPAALQLAMGAGGSMRLRARAISMAQLTGILGSLINQSGSSGFFSLADTGSRPIIDQTGFNGYFDVDDMKWAALSTADSPNASDAPSLETALAETLGLKLVSTKGPVEVVIIDSIDHPTEN